MSAPATGRASPPPRGPAWLRRWLGKLLVAYVVLRALIVTGVCLAGLIVVTSIAGARVESIAWRLVIGGAAVLGAPLCALLWLRSRVARRGGRLRLGVGPSLAIWNVVVLALLCLGLSDTVGRAVRRRGDWFLGATDGWLPRRYRRGIAVAGLWMERFDVPPEARALLAEAAVPQLPPVIREPTHPASQPVETGGWYTPLPTRVVPRHAACRFGAPRRGRFPPECELGHCGVDLEQPRGTPVRAVHDAVVQMVVRDEAAGCGSGRTVSLLHKEGQLQTTYLHLHTIRADLRAGSRVAGGDLIGTVGSTGNALGPHLHFGLALRQGEPRGRRVWEKGRSPGKGQTGAWCAQDEALRFIDPEPLIRHWSL